MSWKISALLGIKRVAVKITMQYALFVLLLLHLFIVLKQNLRSLCLGFQQAQE